ncbi:MAG: SDR family oxidoreductase [Planctomycetota bacterium]
MSERVVIVTGASSGIGLATSGMLARRGWSLALGARDEQRLMNAANQIDTNERPLLLPTDVSRREDVERLVERTLDRFGRIDAIVNNAGMGEVVPVAETTWDLLERTMRTNTIGPAYLVARAWPALVESGSGRIVNVSSYATLDPFPGFFAYAASKGALELTSLSARAEGGDAGIKSFNVCPAGVETPLLRRAFDESVVPASMTLTPEDVAKVLVACLEGERDGEACKRIYLSRSENAGVDERVV